MMLILYVLAFLLLLSLLFAFFDLVSGIVSFFIVGLLLLIVLNFSDITEKRGGTIRNQQDASEIAQESVETLSKESATNLLEKYWGKAKQFSQEAFKEVSGQLQKK